MTCNITATGRGASPTRPHSSDASERRPYQMTAPPANMGVAQLASHLPHYHNSRTRPIFLFLRLLPQRSRRRRAPTNEPIGRGVSPTRPQIWAWRNWLLTCPTTTTLVCARFISSPAAYAAAVTPEACPYQRPHLVGTRLRHVRGRLGEASLPMSVPTNVRPKKQKPAAFRSRALFI